MKEKIITFLKKIWNNKTTQKIISIGSILFSVSILGWLIFSQWDLLQVYLVNIRFEFLGISFIVYSLILLITSGIWAQIMNVIGHKSSFAVHFYAFCISALGKRLPGTLWYVAWRANIYQDEDHSSNLVILTSGIEMIAIVLSATIVSIVFAIPLINQFKYSLIGFALVLVTVFLFMIPKVNQWIFKKLKVDFEKFSYKNTAFWTLEYIIVWLLNGVLLFSIANIFGNFNISDLGYFIGALSLTGVLSRIFLFLPSNFGFNEVSLSLLLSGIMPSSLAVIVALSNRIIIILFETIWALVAIAIRRLSRRINPN